MIEKYRTIGNECGGTSVQHNVLEHIVQILGSDVITSLKEEKPEEFVYLEYQIAMKLKTVNKSNIMRIRIPHFALEMSGIFDKSPRNVHDVYGKRIKGIAHLGDKMLIDSDIIHNLFQPTIDKIINLMEKVFTDYKDAYNVKAIIIVGGFAENVLVQDAVRQYFPKKHIVIPDEPVTAVMRGAVLCGHQHCQYMKISSSEVKIVLCVCFFRHIL